VPVAIEVFEVMRFKQSTVIEFSAEERIPPMDVHAVCRQGMEINVLT
jgi:hypothetical protein